MLILFPLEFLLSVFEVIVVLEGETLPQFKDLHTLEQVLLQHFSVQNRI